MSKKDTLGSQAVQEMFAKIVEAAQARELAMQVYYDLQLDREVPMLVRSNLYEALDAIREGKTPYSIPLAVIIDDDSRFVQVNFVDDSEVMGGPTLPGGNETLN